MEIRYYILPCFVLVYHIYVLCGFHTLAHPAVNECAHTELTQAWFRVHPNNCSLTHLRVGPVPLLSSPLSCSISMYMWVTCGQARGARPVPLLSPPSCSIYMWVTCGQGSCVCRLLWPFFVPFPCWINDVQLRIEGSCPYMFK